MLRSELALEELDRKSTRLNSSHLVISYAVFCLKKKKQATRSWTLFFRMKHSCSRRRPAGRCGVRFAPPGRSRVGSQARWANCVVLFFFFNDTATTEIYTLSLHDALPISHEPGQWGVWSGVALMGIGLAF